MQTDVTSLIRNKPDNTIRENEKRTCQLIEFAVSGEGNVIKKETEKILQHKNLNRNTACVGCKNKSFAGNNRGNWNHLKIFQIVPEHHTGKTQNQGTADNSHIGHCTHILWKVLMLKYKTFNMGCNITCAKNCNCRITATLYTLETMFVFRGIIINSLYQGNNNNNVTASILLTFHLTK